MTLGIVRSGTWMYDDCVAMPVDIVGLDFDFWYEIGKADNDLEPGEEPGPFSAEGFLYYARFRHAGEYSLPTWVESLGHRTIDAAMNDAVAKVPGEVLWTT